MAELEADPIYEHGEQNLDGSRNSDSNQEPKVEDEAFNWTNPEN